ncbi:protein Shroom2-like [Rhinophrynus dorsalis]
MENLEIRVGQERFLPEGAREVHQGLVGDGQAMVERKVLEGYRFVDVILTGGAPWGFTLKGGKEHGEPLIITKVEDGSKAADSLMAGDEIVNINDLQLAGYRQEAISLVKGSYKTLKMIVKRRNDVGYRPHSWHSTKYIENPMESVAAQHFSHVNVNSSWDSKYHSSSSSHDLSNPWDQTILHRNSGHFSSMGSMDSIDQTCQFGRLTSAKSNNSIDHLGNQNKRDSAYGSFSTSFITPDHSLCKAGSSSTENILYKINEWDNKNLAYGKTSPSLNETRRYEDRQGYQSSAVFCEANKTQRPEDFADSRNSGRSNFAPVWYIPDKKKTSSPPPPPPPLRSDSYAATKSHEKPSGPTHSEITSTQHFNVVNRSHPRPDWNTDISDYQQRLVRVTDRNLADMKRTSSSSYQADLNFDQGLSPYNDRYNNSPKANRLQSSLSTNDVRFAQSSYNSHHQRQYSDESTLFQNTRPSTSSKPNQLSMASYSGIRELPADSTYVYHPHQVRAMTSPSTSNSGGKQNVDNNGQNSFYVLSAKQPPGTTAHLLREEYCKAEARSSKTPTLHENHATNAQISSYSIPQETSVSSPENFLHSQMTILKIIHTDHKSMITTGAKKEIR